MKTRCNSVAIVTTILISVASAVSCNAANWFSFYVIGGLGQTETPELSFAASSGGVPPTVVSKSDSDKTFRLGGGYSFNEFWSVEASYIVGPSQERTLSSEISLFDQVVTQTADIKLNLTLYVASVVYELPFRDPISFVGKIGVAFVKGESEFSTSGILGFPGAKISDTDEKTRAFASSGFRISFMEERAAATFSIVKYQDLPQMDQVLEFDLLWRF